MKPILSFSLFTFLLFASCMDSSEEKKTAEALDRSSKPALQKPIDKPERPDLNYRISITRIDSVEFFRIRKKVNPKAEKPEKITDFEKAKKRLRGIVELWNSTKVNLHKMSKRFISGTGKCSPLSTWKIVFSLLTFQKKIFFFAREDIQPM